MKHLLFTTIAAVLVVGCGGPPKNIHQAAEQGDIEAVKQYLDGGANVNANINDGTSPLHLAAVRGHKETAKLLIAKGADVNAKMVSGAKKGNTPLDDANETGNTETADLLRKHGGKTAKELRAEGK